MARKLSNVCWLLAAAFAVFGFLAFQHNGSSIAYGLVFGWVYAAPLALVAYVLSPGAKRAP